MKTAGDSTRFKRDKDGKWWWYGKNKEVPYRLRTFFKECEFCHAHFLIPIGRKSGKHCSRQCAKAVFTAKNPDFYKKENNGRWTGGRLKRKGYVLIHSPDHPACQGNTRTYVLEHRLIMEKHLDRYLERFETIHHINGIKDDNRLENLELWTRAQPYGVRAKDIPHCPTCACRK